MIAGSAGLERRPYLLAASSFLRARTCAQGRGGVRARYVDVRSGVGVSAGVSVGLGSVRVVVGVLCTRLWHNPS
eukprot:6178716-Pleurochrysis_carterae.AAC.1